MLGDNYMTITNSELEKAIPFATVFCCPHTSAFLSLSDDKPEHNGLLFEKELVYEGQFVKDDGKSERLEFAVTKPIIDHWKETADSMLANGVRIPMPIDHTTDPHKKRAELVGTRVGVNKRGKASLFGKVLFDTPENARLAASSDVSIFVTHEATDGHGKKYLRPIRHVAFTDYPVIPGLEKFQAIAASLIGDLDMASPLLALAQQLGVPQAETMDDAGLTNAIVTLFKTKTGPQAQPQAGQQMPGMQPQGMQPQHQLPPRMAASLTKILKDGRQSKLESLVAKGNITKATCDELSKEWCGDKSLTFALSLSLTSGDETADATDDTAFDNLCIALSHNVAMQFDEKTGKQLQLQNGLALSHTAAQVNPLVADAERRAKEAVEAA
jgi:hypothetical protein